MGQRRRGTAGARAPSHRSLRLLPTSSVQLSKTVLSWLTTLATAVTGGGSGCTLARRFLAGAPPLLAAAATQALDPIGKQV